MTSSAAALDEAYLGTWSRTGVACENENAMQIARTGLSGHEFACTIKRSKREKNGWRVDFNCSGEGETYALRVRWRLLKDGRLRETIDGKVREYSRCASVPGTQRPESFADQCMACFNEAQQLLKSVGGYCPADCADVFSTMVCDAGGVCRLPN